MSIPTKLEPSAKSLSRGLSTHILPTNAAMIDVCMTVLSIGGHHCSDSQQAEPDFLVDR